MAELTDKDTIVVVGVTRKDEYGNLWVTPKGGGKEIKIAAKREPLHDLFQQGKAVMCHWETYRNNPYVSDAKWVEGELPEPQEPIEPEPVEEEWKPPKKRGDPKNRAFALSYAKDLAVADKIKYGQIISTAELFYEYLEGNITIPEELIIKFVQEQVKAQLKVKEG